MARHEAIMTGTGGRGVLLVGRILATAAMGVYKNVLWLPTYAITMRGGAVECSVILDDEEILSPVLNQVNGVVCFDASQSKIFESRIKPGGVLVTETAGLKEDLKRDDINIFYIPALQIAIELGDPQISNFLMTGLYLAASNCLSPELYEKDVKARMAGRDKILSMNLMALRKGIELYHDGKGVVRRSLAKKTASAR